MLLADTNVDSQRSLRVSAEINARDLDETVNFERYITGEDKSFKYYLYMSSSDSSQTLLLNVR